MALEERKKEHILKTKEKAQKKKDSQSNCLQHPINSTVNPEHKEMNVHGDTEVAKDRFYNDGMALDKQMIKLFTF